MFKTFSVALIVMSVRATEFFPHHGNSLTNDWGFNDPLVASIDQSVYNTFDDVMGDFESSHDDDFGFHSLLGAQKAVQSNFLSNSGYSAGKSNNNSSLFNHGNSLVNDFDTLSYDS